MSDLRSGKRKEHDALIDVCNTVSEDVITEGSGHAQKQHKTFGADMKPFCSGSCKPAYPGGLRQRRQQAVKQTPSLLSPPARTHSPSSPAPLSWRPPEMSGQMQAAHIKQQHAAQMARLLQQLPGQSVTAQMAAQRSLVGAADSQLCDAAYTQADATADTAPTPSEQCASPGKSTAAATDLRCWSTSPTAGLTKLSPGTTYSSRSPCLDMAKAPKPWEQLSFQYGKVANSPSPLSQRTGIHKQASLQGELASDKPLPQAQSGQGADRAAAAYNLTDYFNEDADMQAALEASLASFEVEQMRSTAEPLPLRAETGSGIVWQNDLDTTVQAHKAPELQSQQHKAVSKQPSSKHTNNEADHAGQPSIEQINNEADHAEQPNSGKEPISKPDAGQVKTSKEATAGDLNNEDIEVLKALSLKELQAYEPCKEACTLDDLCEDVDHNLQLEDSYNQFGGDATDNLSLACSEELIEIEEANDFQAGLSAGHGLAVQQQFDDQQAKADALVDEWVMIDKDVEAEFHT